MPNTAPQHRVGRMAGMQTNMARATNSPQCERHNGAVQRSYPMTYNTPFPKQAPWFIYGPYKAPNGNWYCGYVVANGQLAMSGDTLAGHSSFEDCQAYFNTVDHGLAHANANA